MRLSIEKNSGSIWAFTKGILMSKKFSTYLQEVYPALHYLLVEVASAQYSNDWINDAIEEFAANSDETDRQNILHELDAAHEKLASDYDELSQFTNFKLTSSKEAQAFLINLRAGVERALTART